jgi:N-acetylmuramoyl-L-alanine amidase
MKDELINIKKELEALTQRVDAYFNLISSSQTVSKMEREIIKGEPIICIRAGHGGIDPETNAYTTKGKQWMHSHSLPIALHKEDADGKHFYEGVWNRAMAALISKELWSRGIPNKSVHHEYKDIRLMSQVDTINNIHRNENPICLLLELHSNAANTQARGFEVFTSPGESKSDKYADMLYKKIAADFPLKMRRDRSDGDYDKEARFTMITKTWCPAILPEFGFYDNAEDILIIMNPEVMQRYAIVLADVAEQAYKDKVNKN